MKKFSIGIQTKYLRVPFKSRGRSFAGCDCGGLVWLIYKEELGILLPNLSETYSGTSLKNAVEVSDVVSSALANNSKEIPICKAQPFDVLSLVIANTPMHLGIVVEPPYFMHIMEGFTKVQVQSWDSIEWKNRVEGCFRHEKMS